MRGKAGDGFAPMGPFLVTPDEVRNPHALALETRVNGEVRQTTDCARGHENGRSELDLRPMSTGDLLDRSVRMYRRYFLPILGILLGPACLMFPFELWLARRFGATVRWQVALNPLGIPGLTLLLLITGSVFAVSGAALIELLAERSLGAMPGIWASYRAVLGRALSFFLASFALSLLWCVPAALVYSIGLPGIIGFQPWWWYYISSVSIQIITGVCGAGLGLFRLLLVFEVMVIERCGLGPALRRSWDLMRRNIGRGVLIFIFTVAAYQAVSIVVYVPGLILEAWRPGLVRGLPEIILAQVAGLLSVPLAMIPFVLFYLDVRIRKEALDLDVLAKNLGLAGMTPGTTPNV